MYRKLEVLPSSSNLPTLIPMTLQLYILVNLQFINHHNNSSVLLCLNHHKCILQHNNNLKKRNNHMKHNINNNLMHLLLLLYILTINYLQQAKDITISRLINKILSNNINDFANKLNSLSFL